MSIDTLATYPFVVVRLACTRCPRKGSLRLARLAERHGADMLMVDLLAFMSVDCPFRQPGKRFAGRFEECGAHLPDLAKPVPPDLPPGMGKLRVVIGGKR